MKEKLFPHGEPFGAEIRVEASREFILSRWSLCRSSMKDLNKANSEFMYKKTDWSFHPCSKTPATLCIHSSTSRASAHWRQLSVSPDSLSRRRVYLGATPGSTDLVAMLKCWNEKKKKKKEAGKSKSELTILFAISWWGKRSIPDLCCVGLTRMWRAWACTNLGRGEYARPEIFWFSCGIKATVLYLAFPKNKPVYHWGNAGHRLANVDYESRAFPSGKSDKKSVRRRQ